MGTVALTVAGQGAPSTSLFQHGVDADLVGMTRRQGRRINLNADWYS